MSWRNAGSQMDTLPLSLPEAAVWAGETPRAKPGIDTSRPSLNLTQSQAQVPVLDFPMLYVTLDKSLPPPSLYCDQFLKWR